MEDNKIFIMQDSRSNTGSNAMFWRLGGGYTSNIDEAETFNLEEAQGMHDSRNTDIPLLKRSVEGMAIYKIDCQYLPPPIVNTCNGVRYVAVRRIKFDGNDIYFATNNGGHTSTDFNIAKIICHADLSSGFFSPEMFDIYDYGVLMNIRRRTIEASSINYVEASLNHGIKLKKKKRQKPSTGKNRLNCNNCGRIVWDYGHEHPDSCKSCEAKNGR